MFRKITTKKDKKKQNNKFVNMIKKNTLYYEMF